MTEQIQITYNGTTIAYDEFNNLWRFTLCGRDRSYGSLSDAKQFIDKPAPVKSKPFEKISAWFFSHYALPIRVEVTGIADKGYGSGPHVWIKYANGNRSKESAPYKIYESTPENDAIALGVIEKFEQIESLNKEIEEIKLKLAPLRIAPEE